MWKLSAGFKGGGAEFSAALAGARLNHTAIKVVNAAVRRCDWRQLKLWLLIRIWSCPGPEHGNLSR